MSANRHAPRDNAVRAVWLATFIALVMILSITIGLCFVAIGPDSEATKGYFIGVATGAVCSLFGGIVAAICYRK